MVIESLFRSGDSSPLFRSDGAACRIRTGDPLITKKSARKGEFCKWLILRGQDVVTSLERQPHSFFIGMEGQQ